MRNRMESRREAALVDQLARLGYPAFGRVPLGILALLLAQEHGQQRSMRELAQYTDCAIYNVFRHLSRLRVAGLVSGQPGRARAMRATCRWIPASQLGEKPGKVD